MFYRCQGIESSILWKNINRRKFSTARQIRLCKRMSELNLCSRREADKFISTGRVLLQGKPVEPILGQKVNFDEIHIKIMHQDEYENLSSCSKSGHSNFNWQRIRGDTIVVNKPEGYVSGQPDPKHGYLPAARLLTRENIYLPDKELEYTLRSGKYLNFAKRFRSGHDTDLPSTLQHYAPAGRLDLESTGVLIMTKNGVLAKTILSSDVHKEYIVKVEPALAITSVERQMGLTSLPYPRWDLSVLLRGGKRLWNDPKPLKPLVAAEWLENDFLNDNKLGFKDDKMTGEGIWTGRGTIRMVLKEGKKKQIRRMCREILGLHVISLTRTRVGSVKLEDLPSGKWRPLREREARELLSKG